MLATGLQPRGKRGDAVMKDKIFFFFLPSAIICQSVNHESLSLGPPPHQTRLTDSLTEQSERTLVKEEHRRIFFFYKSYSNHMTISFPTAFRKKLQNSQPFKLELREFVVLIVVLFYYLVK